MTNPHDKAIEAPVLFQQGNGMKNVFFGAIIAGAISAMIAYHAGRQSGINDTIEAFGLAVNTDDRPNFQESIRSCLRTELTADSSSA